MSPASPADLTAYLTHEDASVRGRAWAWQSAMGLLMVDGLQPSAYLAETARRHIEGYVTLDIAARLVDAYYLLQPDPAAEAADRRAFELARMLGEKHEDRRRESASAPEPPPASPSAPAAAPPAASPAPEDASGLHLRQKRLLRALGSHTLSVPELLHALQLNTRQSFMRVWLSPAMDMGLVKALHPSAPRHPQQKYLLTRKGQRFLKQLIRK